jgi:two-component system, LytTR family, response regulator
MNKITCIIVDDEQFALDMMKDYVQQTPFLELVYHTTNPLLAVEWLNHHKADLCFADVQMPQLSGIDLIKTLGGQCRFILCTAHSEYALQGFEHDVIDYLLKPTDYARFLIAAQKALKQLSPAAQQPVAIQDGFFIKTGQQAQMIKIGFTEIIYAEACGHYVYIKTATEKLICYTNLKELGGLLPAVFMRVHNSYIVSLPHIVALEGKMLTLRHADKPIIVGRTYRDGLRAALPVAG